MATANKLTGTATVYGCGVLVCYASRAPTGVGVDGAGGKFEYQAADGCLKAGRRRLTALCFRD